MYERLIGTVSLGFLALGCAIDNPDFDGPTTTEATSEAETEPTDTDPSDTDASAGETCTIAGGAPLFIDLGSGCSSDDPNSWDKWYEILEIQGSVITAGICEMPNCVGCLDGTPFPLEVSPLNLTPLGQYGNCLHVNARRAPPGDPSSCEFDSLTIEVVNTNAGGVRIPALIARNSATINLPPLDPQLSPMAAGFNPPPMVDEVCNCASFPEECCGSAAPTTYEFDVGLAEPVNLDMPVAEIMLDNHSYEFEVHDAFLSGECEAEPSISWSLIRKN